MIPLGEFTGTFCLGSSTFCLVSDTVVRNKQSFGQPILAAATLHSDPLGARTICVCVTTPSILSRQGFRSLRTGRWPLRRRQSPALSVLPNTLARRNTEYGPPCVTSQAESSESYFRIAGLTTRASRSCFFTLAFSALQCIAPTSHTTPSTVRTLLRHCRQRRFSHPTSKTSLIRSVSVFPALPTVSTF